MSDCRMFHRVALLTPPFSSLTYMRPSWLPEDDAWRPGTRVAVPLGKGGCRMGIVLDSGSAESGLDQAVDARPMLWPLERAPLLATGQLELARQLALRQMQQPGRILQAMLPAGLRSLRARLRVQDEDGIRQWSVRQLWDLACRDTASLEGIGRAWAAGRADWLASREDAADSEVCVVLRDPPWPLRPRADKQRAVLELLWEQGSLSRKALRQAVPASAPALASLVKQGLVAVRLRDGDEALDDPVSKALLPPEEPLAAIRVNTAQASALEAFQADLAAEKAATRLLFGITGSGKTLVYLKLAEACLRLGRSALIIAPEVALALKLRRDVRAFMPEAPVFLVHGYQSPALRERQFLDLARREAPCIVVGTRSALFIPAPRVGAIVLDEEHDASFKQDEGLTYQAKEVAWFRASQEQALLVLGSATPDVKTFHAAGAGHIPLHRLDERAGGGLLPEVRMVDIKTSDPDVSPLAPETMTALRETVAAGDQAVIMLNRRGYAPHMYCLGCGKVARCPDCDIGLTYHKGRERLICHYCGHAVPFPAPCGHCGGLHYRPMGQGTERLEENLAAQLPPGSRVLRLDRDSTRRPGRMEEILEAFARQEAQVLVGTQMLSKGHHFPGVTLAVVADGDMGLNVPDYRAAERTFQLLVQSAGRAGRGSRKGRVIIQTRDPDHPFWALVRQADYEGFCARELALREKRRYPPFVRLALVRLSYPMQWKSGPDVMAELGKTLREAGRNAGVTVLGPAPAPLPLLRARRRFQCLLKADTWSAIRRAYASLAERTPDSVRVSLDLDPVNML